MWYFFVSGLLAAGVRTAGTLIEYFICALRATAIS
jgi:hypothetical protein